MKYIKIAAIILSVSLVFTSCAFEAYRKDTPAQESVSKVENEEINIEKDEEKTYTYTFVKPEKGDGVHNPSSIICYAEPMDSLKDLYDKADLIIQFRIKDKRSYNIENSVYSRTYPDIIKTFKGEYKKDVPIIFDSGTITIDEYIETVPEEYKEQTRAQLLETDPIYYSHSFAGGYEPFVGETYIAFLVYFANDPHYTGGSYNAIMSREGLFKVNGDFIENKPAGRERDCDVFSKDVAKECAEYGSVAFENDISSTQMPEKEITYNDSKIKVKEKVFEFSELTPIEYNGMNTNCIVKGVSIDGFIKAIENITE